MRYSFKIFLPIGDKNFDGILKYLPSQSNGNINKKLDIIVPSNTDWSFRVNQFYQNNCYQSTNSQSSWICFDFKKNIVIPTLNTEIYQPQMKKSQKLQ